MSRPPKPQALPPEPPPEVLEASRVLGKWFAAQRIHMGRDLRLLGDIIFELAGAYEGLNILKEELDRAVSIWDHAVQKAVQEEDPAAQEALNVAAREAQKDVDTWKSSIASYWDGREQWLQEVKGLCAIRDALLSNIHARELALLEIARPDLTPADRRACADALTDFWSFRKMGRKAGKPVSDDFAHWWIYRRGPWDVRDLRP